MISQKQIVGSVVRAALTGPNPKQLLFDLPWIRQALNDAMDSAERSGELLRCVSDHWSQEYMVVAVRRGIQKGLLT